MRKADIEKAEAIARLREMLSPGDTVTCVVRSVARSGMSRTIDFYKIRGPQDRLWLTRFMARAGIGSWDDKREALRIGGCGMDMGFHCVSHLSYLLWPEGFGCTGERCPSNDHSNGDRDYTPHASYLHDKAQHEKIGKPPSSEPHWHKSGDYALRHEWL